MTTEKKNTAPKNVASKKHSTLSPSPRKTILAQNVQQLYDIGTAFWQSAALIAAVQLDLFSHLNDKALTPDTVARQLATDRRWTEKLLIACAALGLLEKKAGKYRNTALAAQLLIAGQPHYQGDFIRHLGTLWGRFASLTDTIKTGLRSSQEMQVADGGREWILSAHNVALSGQADLLVSHLDLKDYQHLCDIGGGPGTYAVALCLRYPQLRATVFDDPEVAPVATALITQAGLQDRITVNAAQILYGDYDVGCDVVLLSGVLHGLTEANCKKMLRKVFNALPQNGLVVVQEMVLDDEEPKPLLAALFNLNMTLGASYSVAQIMAWLYDAGFVKPEVIELPQAPWLDHLIVAQKV
jgi:3-hydroxy-5-methyl-1-naphthoate 3-O-methyltransferase